MADQYILSLDQGTTGSTALVIAIGNQNQTTVVGRATVDFEQHYPKSGWVEHDLEQIWASVRAATLAAIEKAKLERTGFSENQIASIGITNQRETLCVFDRKTSRPIARAIVWQCRRSHQICSELRDEGRSEAVKKQTGLVLDPYFSGTKLRWLMENDENVAKHLKNKSAVVGTIDTYLLHRLTAGAVHATEPSNASRTLLFDIRTGQFDAGLCELMKVPSLDVLPEVRDSAGVFGKTKGLDFLPDGISISGILGDQQAALAGQACYGVGEAKCTYGTGAFLLVNQGSEIKYSSHGMLTTIAWQLNGERTYAFEGSSFIAGAAIQFMRDQFGIIAHAADSEKMATNAEAAPGLVFVPALAGLGAPHWNALARGALLGLHRGTTKAELIRAALEGIAFQVYDLITSMNQGLGEDMSVLRVDGGAAANNLLLRMQANYLNIPVDRPENLETTAFGAAMFAALGCGIFNSTQDLKGVRAVDRIFEPDPNFTENRKTHLAAWQRAIAAVTAFAPTDA